MAEAERHVLVTGGAGQIGTELKRLIWPEDVVVHSPDRSVLDLLDAAAVARAFQATPYSLVINTAAYTAVDKAEDDVAGVFAANAVAPALLADQCRRSGAGLIQVSTDYVFNGEGDRPYEEGDPTSPLGVYGASKLAGELAVLSGNPKTVVLRTAWVFSPHRANFVKTMLRVGLQHSQIRVVADQHGCPTSAKDIAAAILVVATRVMDDPDAPTGIYHFVNDGAATWHEFAQAIFDTYGMELSPDVVAIETKDYPTPAKRPKNSRLANGGLLRDFGVTPRDWRLALADTIAEIKKGREP